MKEGQINPDILIIGGGVIGLSIARELHKRCAHKIAVVEKGTCGREASWAAAGMLGPQAEADETAPFVDLCRESRDLYPQFAEELLEETGIDIELERSGTLHLAFNDRDVAELHRRYEWQSAAALPVERLSAADLRRLESNISPAVIQALLFPNDWQVENRKLLFALRRYAELNGIEVVEGRRVETVRLDGDKVIGAATPDGDIDAGETILATGAWTSLIKLGPREIPFKVEPVRGQMITFRPEEKLFHHVIYGRSGYIVPRMDGRILAGSTTENVGFDTSTTSSANDSLYEMAFEIIPKIRSLEVADRWAGLRPFAPDGFPVLGRIGSIGALFVATAHYRNGILLAPVTARLAAGTLLDNVESEYCALFGPDRFGLTSISAAT